MKKLITVILILAMLLPAAAFSDGASDVIGCWVHYELSTNELPSVTFLYLAEDGVCYFLIQAFNHDEAGIGRTFVGTWTMDSNGAVTAKTGNNTETTLVFSPAGNVALNPRTNEMYVNLTALGIY